jgi:hypothetical protein
MQKFSGEGQLEDARCLHAEWELTNLLDTQNPYHLGEMAHIIAHGALGPRADGEQPDDTYDNLILLCPNHHRQIDKAPDQFPADLLRQWKVEHEAWIEHAFSEQLFENINDLITEVSVLLLENQHVWLSLGPESELAELHPGSNLYKLWHMRRLDTIIPNNKRIMNLLAANKNLLTDNQLKAFIEFKDHAMAYELHVNERLEDYPRFPKSFAMELGREQQRK